MKKNKYFISYMWLIIIVVFFIMFLGQFYNQHLEMRDLKNQKEVLLLERSYIESLIEHRKEQLELIGSKEMIEEKARKRLLMVKEYESIILFEEYESVESDKKEDINTKENIEEDINTEENIEENPKKDNDE